MRRYREVIDLLSESASPIIRYKTRVNVLGADADHANAQKIRRKIKTSPVALGLLADLDRSEPTDREGRPISTQR